MSFDVSLTIDTGGEYPAKVADIGNITYNVNPMFHQALGCGLRDLDGRTCEDILEQLRNAVSNMENYPEIYEALNPENGWGNSTITLNFLIHFLEEAKNHPKTTVRIW